MSITDGLDIYLVGGAVRDRLLGLPIKDRDWVVVGATASDLKARGFKQVGNDFPVFLHPDTGEEYALARTERKTQAGHQGFAFDSTTSVTLEDDLLRRDFTINAIAETPAGQLIDPFGGAEDLTQRVLRHVSDAFVEDPLRVLRAARFVARFVPQGMTIANDTMRLLARMSAGGELDSLTPERVWSETERALSAVRPSIYFSVLRACGALSVVFPEVDALFGVPQPEQWHPEVDTGLHTLLSLDAAASMTDDVSVRFAVLVHDLGKATTPEDQWPSHHGHERRSRDLAAEFCDKLRAPKRFRKLAADVAEFHTHCHRATTLKPKTLLKVLDSIGAFRDPAQLERFVIACEADARGRTGFESRAYPQADYVRGAFAAAQTVRNADIAAQGHTGAAFGEALRKARIGSIAAFKAQFVSTSDEHDNNDSSQ
ncbi:MAG: multifunctional CCA addition/repair protein [Pseudomonadota bacterium]